MKCKITFLMIVLTLSITAQDSSMIDKIFPHAVKINNLVYDGAVYFRSIDYDILTAKKSIDAERVHKETMGTYINIMNFRPETDDTSEDEFQMIKDRKLYQKMSKKKVIDSILFPQAMKVELQSILFDEFSNRPYFDSLFSKQICNPDSVFDKNWQVMKSKLSVFKDSSMLINFDKIDTDTSNDLYLVPAGLLLLKNGKDFNWYIPFGWEYKEIPEKVAMYQKQHGIKPGCHHFEHILGYIYSFDFSKKLYEFQCK